ncbi:hypothetical protein LTR64_006055 [Lithohypha guttulata]|uniref:uncharacterized protein n=1 Tax=Lithohypha guttulata TaxID=1690604 RepID=UPI002DDF228D|nr:hypothetical protein LTR51_002147 [Lithohypha guttulata]
MSRTFTIEPAHSDHDLQATVELIYEYVKWLDLDISFQNFDAEIAEMPGCVALRPLGPQICEVKRLWVRNAAKGLGVGKALVAAAIKVGKQLGYQKIRLDTLSKMAAALGLYQSFGFVEIEPYYQTPLPNTHFLELDLTRCSVGSTDA